MLELYSRIFDTIEVDSTAYGTPALSTIESWVAAQEKQKARPRVAVAAPPAPAASPPLTSTNAAAPAGAVQ